MASIGGTIPAGTSQLFTGPLGVAKLAFDGWDLGKTTADANIQPDQDIKDIMYQQDGTKGADHVRTGQDMICNVTFGEIETKLLELLMGGVSSNSVDSLTIGRSVYQSMRDTEAGVLRITAVDGNGVPSGEIDDSSWYYEAIPIVQGDLVNWGADTQRNFPMQFRIKYHEFATGEIIDPDKPGAFGYFGDPAVEQVPAVVWPDVEAPTIVTAIASTDTLLTVTFDENIAFQTAFAAGHYIADVEGAFVAPASGIITTVALALTFAGATFTAGDVIKLSISAAALEDTEATANLYPGVANEVVTNTVV